MLCDGRKLVLAICPVQNKNLQLRRKLLRFGKPIRHQAGRRDDQRGIGEVTSRFLQRDQGEDLNGLAQPHFVGEDPSQPALAEQIEPCHALRLIGPKRGAKGRRQFRRGQSPRLKQACEAAKTVGAPKGEAVVFDAEQRNDVRARQSDPPGSVPESAAHMQAMQREHERQEAVGSQRDVPAIG